MENKQSVSVKDLQEYLKTFKSLKFTLYIDEGNYFALEDVTNKTKQGYHLIKYNYLGNIVNNNSKVIVLWDQINKSIISIIKHNFGSQLANVYLETFFGISKNHTLKTFEDFETFVNSNAETMCLNNIKKSIVLKLKNYLKESLYNKNLEIKDNDQTIEISYSVKFTLAATLNNEAISLQPDILFQKILAGVPIDEIINEYEVETNSTLSDNQKSFITNIPNEILSSISDESLCKSALEVYKENIKKALASSIKDFSYVVIQQPNAIHLNLVGDKPIAENKDFKAYYNLVSGLLNEIQINTKK